MWVAGGCVCREHSMHCVSVVLSVFVGCGQRIACKGVRCAAAHSSIPNALHCNSKLSMQGYKCCVAGKRGTKRVSCRSCKVLRVPLIILVSGASSSPAGSCILWQSMPEPQCSSIMHCRPEASGGICRWRRLQHKEASIIGLAVSDSTVHVCSPIAAGFGLGPLLMSHHTAAASWLLTLYTHICLTHCYNY